MNKQRQAAKAQMIALMQAGHPWQEAATMAGVQIGRSAAYQLLRNVRQRGAVALQDARHGHPVKLRQPVRDLLEAICRQVPSPPSREVQAALQERFGVFVSIGHLNRIRAKLGLGSRAISREKNTTLPLVRQKKRTGTRERVDCSW